MRYAALVLALFASSALAAECVRWKPDPNAPPQLDGPGSFGPLQDTVTLACLRYVGTFLRGGYEWVQIADENGKVYDLRVGYYMGENSGIIRKIDGRYIYLEQMVPRGNTWVRRMVKFPKHSDNEQAK